MKKIMIFLAFALVASVANAQLSTTLITNDDNVEIINGNTITYSVLCNDTYISPDSVTVSINTTASNGVVTDNGDGTFTYTNSGNYDNETLTYTLSHIAGNSENGIINITNTSVAPVNNAPVATNDIDSAYMGLVVIVNVLSNDNDVDGDSMIVVSTSNGNNGTVTTNGINITYTPTDTNWAGYDTVTYTISDGNGGLDTATVYIQSGTTAQINTYNIISPYFGISMNLLADWGNSFLTMNSNGSVNSVGSAPTNNNSNWKILPNGDIKFTYFGNTSIYPVTPLSSGGYNGFSFGAYQYMI